MDAPPRGEVARLEAVTTEAARLPVRRAAGVGVGILGALLLASAGCGGSPAKSGAPDAATSSGAVAVPAVVPIPMVMPSLPRPASPRPHLHLTMRSTPAGASVSIDGRLVGNTPTRWEMDDDAHPHDFAFVLRGYAPWRLRFSPSQDGVVHATLEAIRGPDAGAR